MTKKSTKTKSKAKYCDPRPVLCRPSTWVIALLMLALLVVYGVAMYGLKHIETKTDLDIAKLAVFDDLAEGYIRNMESPIHDQPTIKQITGYGVSDEDGAFYITFDFVPYTVEDNNRVPAGEPRHAIIYFWKDAERGTYSHAFSYHDDDYHPAGTYIQLSE